MTLEEFKDVYKDKTPVEKLRLMQVQHDYWRNDVKDRVDANWRGNFDEARRYASECDAMRDRITWLMEEITKAIEASEPRVLTLDEAEKVDICWMERKSGMIEACRVAVSLTRNDVTVGRISMPPIHIPPNGYGRIWRCWTDRPSDAQRDAEPWK